MAGVWAGNIKLRSVNAAIAVALLTVISGCATPLVEDTSRDIAKGAVNEVVAQRFPGVNAAPYTDCIIDNASTQEILDLAQSALTQNTNAAAATVITIAGRPDTTNCIAQNALGSLLLG